MAVTFNTQMNPTVTLPAAQDEKTVPVATQKALDSFESSVKTMEKLAADAPYESSSKTDKKEAIKNKYQNMSYTKRGLIAGIVTGLFTGTAVAGVDMLISGIIKKKNGGITKWIEILNPKKAQSNTGKYLAPTMAIVFFLNNLITGIIADKRKKKAEAAPKVVA